MNPDGSAVWLHTDQLGTVRATTSAVSGDVVATSSYDPVGNKTAASGSQPLLGFAGEYADGETGFLYLRARFYDPVTSQFVSRDPKLAQTEDPYGYAAQNPLTFTDPTGQSACQGFASCAGEAITGAWDYCTDKALQAVACVGLAASVVSGGAGLVGIMGAETGGLAGTASGVSTVATAVSLGAGAITTGADCMHAVDLSCAVGATALGLSAGSLRGSQAAKEGWKGLGNLAAEKGVSASSLLPQSLLVPGATAAWFAGAGGTVLGAPGVGSWLERDRAGRTSGGCSS